MPVYPVFDSAETKYHSNCFEMKEGKFTFESGTPPDYFNSDGQKWNSPVYDVGNLKKENYKYLMREPLQRLPPDTSNCRFRIS